MTTYSPIKQEDHSPKQSNLMKQTYQNPNQDSKYRDANPKYMNQGLPNPRNHCFLICLIQMLYSYKSFRIKVLRSKSKKQIVVLLKEIFLAIEDDKTKNQTKKRKIILKISQYLQENDSGYKNGMQYDSTYIFLKIADDIQNQLEFQKIFTFQYSLECPKNKQHHFDSGMDKIIRDSKCPKCNTLLKLSLEPNTSCYVRRQRNKNQFQENIKQRNSSNQQYIYKVCGEILYYGDGDSGHYMASRVISQNQKQKMFLFDDLTVKEIDSPNYLIYKPILSLYVRSSNVRSTPKEPDVKSDFQGQNHNKKYNEAILSFTYCCCCSWTICCPCCISKVMIQKMTYCCYSYCCLPFCNFICCQNEFCKQ